MNKLNDNEEITRFLMNWRSGRADALNDLMPLVYSQLRWVAQGLMRSERAMTLQPTALVHEAYLRLVHVDVSWQDRTHFFALVATMMRRILVDAAKKKQRIKRGGGETFVLIEDVDIPQRKTCPANVLTLDKALTQLAEMDSRKARVVELRSFAGLTISECADVLSVSCTTVERDLKMARAWLASHMTSASAVDS